MGDSHYSAKALDVLRSLQAPETGLTQEEARIRLQKSGFNELRKERQATALEIFARQFKGFLIMILVFACVISAVLGEITDAVVIGAIVLLNAILGFVQEYRAEQALEALRKLAAPRAKVLREAVIYIPFLQPLFQTVGLKVSDWLIVLAIASSGLLILPEVFMR